MGINRLVRKILDKNKLKTPIYGNWGHCETYQYLLSKNKIPKNRRQLDKFAFAMNSATFISHYEQIMKFFDGSEFDLICAANTVEENNVIKNFAKKNNYNCVYIEDLIRSEVKYKAMVSSVITGYGYGTLKGESYYGALDISDKQIKIVYSLGASKACYDESNKYYDLILCYGPTDADSYAKRFDAKIEQIGYPRFDDYFNNPVSKEEFFKSFNLDMNKKTIVYLPSMTTMNSINAYADKVAKLSEQYNTIVKSHPMTSDKEVAMLEKSNINVKIYDKAYNNQELFGVADFVLVDVGGSAFGAIYVDKNICILNIKDIEKCWAIGEDSEDLKIKEFLVSINEEDDINIILENEELWKEQSESRKMLREKYFKLNFGTSSKATAEKIKLFLQQN